MLVVIEGLDGAGKSTVATKLANLLGWDYQHYPVDLAGALKACHEGGIDTAMAYDMISHPPDKYTNMVLDRYYHSNYAYGGGFFHILEALMPPAFSVLIDITPELSLERCRNRGTDDPDLNISLEERYSIYNRYKQMDFDLVVDGELTPDEVVDKILLYIPRNNPRQFLITRKWETDPTEQSQVIEAYSLEEAEHEAATWGHGGMITSAVEL